MEAVSFSAVSRKLPVRAQNFRYKELPPASEPPSSMTRRSPLLPIFLIVLVDVFGLTLVIPLLAIYAEHFGATPVQATLLVSTYAACQFISGPILGTLSDKYGRKP